MEDRDAFVKFPKMARLSREIIVSEKIDGTNAQVYVDPEYAFSALHDGPSPLVVTGTTALYAGSRTRWISVDKDNHGFAAWVYLHADELINGLGPGRHFGEWWGSGIQRGYGLPRGEKRFSLFNIQRWCAHDATPQRIITGDPRQEKWEEQAPECCHLVPELYRGPFDMGWIDDCLKVLVKQGSYANYGFMDPEGVVVFHTAANVGFKKTIKNDDMPKSLVK